MGATVRDFSFTKNPNQKYFLGVEGGGGGGGRFGGGAGVSELFLLCIQLRDGGATVHDFFTKNPNQNYFFFGGRRGLE